MDSDPTGYHVMCTYVGAVRGNCQQWARYHVLTRGRRDTLMVGEPLHDDALLTCLEHLGYIRSTMLIIAQHSVVLACGAPLVRWSDAGCEVAQLT